MRNPPLGPSEEFLVGPRNAVLGGETHADTDTDTRAFGEAPHGATKRCTGWGKRMRTPPPQPSVEPPYGATKRCTGRGRRHVNAASGAL
eukprot:9355539-Pyramimonas_sp.AAC.1